MRIVLISTYELGRQPFGLASPAAWLRHDGHHVTVVDLACSPMPWPAVEEAELLAFFLPMHTATRLFQKLIEKVRTANPRAHLCGYGLYAPLNDAMLRRLGVQTVMGGEFEQGLTDLARRLSMTRPGELPYRQPEPLISVARQQFRVPDRTGLPALAAYAQLTIDGATRRVGYTEASRGCKHLCRHCPVVPVYRGLFRVVQRDVVLQDIRQQVAAGAQHITFGDPDFFNGPGHAVPIVEALHAEWPELTYDVTIKVEHLLNHRDLLPVLKATNCLFVTSAVESFDDTVLGKLAKGHTPATFVEALALMRATDLALSPTFIPFTPWTTLEAYHDFLRALLELNLADQVAPIQLAIRLLLPEGSLLLDLPEMRSRIQPYDTRALCYPWKNTDPRLDVLCASVQDLIKRQERRRKTRWEIFRQIWDLAETGEFPVDAPMLSRATIPYLTEPWYC